MSSPAQPTARSDAARDALAARYTEIRARIDRACARAGRDPSEVTLVAVSKTFAAPHLRALYDLGVRDFGESYVQEWQEKAPLLPADIRWHFIGHLQSNKVKALLPGDGASGEDARHVSVIHAVDRASVMREIARRASVAATPVFLQVNVGGEASKSGVAAESVEGLLGEAIVTHGLHVVGLMTIPPPVADPQDARGHFAELRALLEGCCNPWLARHAPAHPPLTALSMGMSHDFEVAIEEGATHVRVGSALFGDRTYA